MDRAERILDALAASGSIKVSRLAKDFGVSPVTIRKDLDALERQRFVRRTRGGAVLAPVGEEGAFDERLRRESAAKKAIAREAAAFVHDGDIIALDSSSTSYYLATQLLRKQGLVVVTQSLPTATLLMERSNATVIVPGGTLRRESSAFVGSFSNVLRGRGRIAKAFVGVVGLSPELGLLELAADEADSKAQILEASDEIYALFDATKIAGFGLHPFVGSERVTAIFTDSRATQEFVAEWSALDVAVERVPISDDDATGGALVAAKRGTAAEATTQKEQS